MQSFIGGSIRLGQRHGFYSWSGAHFKANRAYLATNNSSSLIHGSDNSINSSRNHLLQSLGQTRLGSQTKELMLPGCSGGCSMPGLSQLAAMMSTCSSRSMTTAASPTPDSSQSVTDVPPRIKFKRLDKTAKHIMQILDKEAVEEVKAQREIPDIKPGNIVQLRVEVPENKRRVSTIKGIVIARRNAGLNTTFRLRRMVAGVGVESLFPLYSPNIKEIKVLDKKTVRRAKLYYLRDKMNALR
ncbi:PREDICTED: 50S ribosomal protein L19, chloroplastic isoform X1 [Theobroma cacao]|uniref:50S ribosomal protein L19, chloroplastic isoform X1 n=1 Tax=Theobroma cacao TaxID=3641 RepID=A0AB32VY70_THECC|nr:PREDICTED: 50S ribosomal protein L19, chloroplastic isoform X1 [Theobroma cacao]